MREVDQRLGAQAMAAVRKSMPSHRWPEFAKIIAEDRSRSEVKLRKPSSEIDRTLFENLEAFEKDGVAAISARLMPENIAAILKYLEGQPVYSGSHIRSSDRKLKPLAEARAMYPLAGYTMDQLIRAPFLMDLFNHPAIIDFVEAYLGCVPTFYSVNAWWSFPAAKPEAINAQYFHRDTDDWRFCTLFLYLTDVDEAAGPHQVVVGSHTLEGMRSLLMDAKGRGLDVSAFDAEGSFENYFGEDFSSRCETLLGRSVRSVFGSAGAMFFVNTVALHRGLMARQKPRLMAWARYGLGPNTNSADLEQGPLKTHLVPANVLPTPRNRYINRLLFETDRDF
jgi:hypothetical protein